MENAATPEAPDARPPPMPGWVKVFVIAGAALAALVVILLLAGGEHGPWRHGP